MKKERKAKRKRIKQSQEENVGRKKEKMQEVLFFIFRERESSFSLGF